jgi:hypothetical protein
VFKLARLSALLVMASGFANLLPSTANAQKPALIKNVDERGRVPYQEHVNFAQDASRCSMFRCAVSFPPVPAGFRLVITHASAFYRLATGGTFPYTTLGADGIEGWALMLPTPVLSGSNFYITSSPVTYYVEPGSSPTLFMYGQYVTNNGSANAEATVIGYLVAIP